MESLHKYWKDLKGNYYLIVDENQVIEVTSNKEVILDSKERERVVDVAKYKTLPGEWLHYGLSKINKQDFNNHSINLNLIETN